MDADLYLTPKYEPSIRVLTNEFDLIKNAKAYADKKENSVIYEKIIV